MNRERPERCQVCKIAMEYYGNRNGIVGWHTSAEAINSDTSYLCEKCRCEEIQESSNKLTEKD